MKQLETADILNLGRESLPTILDHCQKVSIPYPSPCLQSKIDKQAVYEMVAILFYEFVVTCHGVLDCNNHQIVELSNIGVGIDVGICDNKPYIELTIKANRLADCEYLLRPFYYKIMAFGDFENKQLDVECWVDYNELMLYRLQKSLSDNGKFEKFLKILDDNPRRIIPF